MSEVLFTPLHENISKWQPVVGDFTDLYLRELSLDSEGKERLLRESAAILANCTNPKTESYSEAGLVLGFVQSGKTLSFTTITALARDNGYGIVIVLAGVNNLLREQSHDRLVDDLKLVKYREWLVFDNPGAQKINHANSDYLDFKDRLEQWKSWQAGGVTKKPSILVTVLKQAGRINNLSNLLNSLDLRNVPVLFIDDESDQASPNTKSALNLKTGLDATSSTYEAIANLRKSANRHTYLQYTATPQANLLAAKSDALSPAFSRVISAGPDYVGGEDFFTGDMKNIVEIPAEDEIQAKTLPEEPPKSFQESLRSFWVASAIAMAEKHVNSEGVLATRSMMIQTSARTQPHSLFAAWTRSIRSLWKEALRKPESASYEDLVIDFENAFLEICKTYKTNKSFSEILPWIPEAIDETKIVEVNSTEDAVKVVRWYESPFWILVGGMKLDRGFTVRGITHTYMPRAVSENAATLQQRARFFGYHRAYFGLCRIYIARPTLDAFIAYVEHEKALRESLMSFQGKPLSEWKRGFILDRALNKPVRSNVVGMKLAKNVITEGWVAPRFMYENYDAIEKNVETFDRFITSIKDEFRESKLPLNWIDKRDSRDHELFSDVPIGALQNLLLEMEFTNPSDANLIMPLAVALVRASAQNPDLTADVVLINGLDVGKLEGREIKGDKGIDNLFIGRSPKTATKAEQLNYVGDREIYTDGITFHLRKVLVKSVVDSNENMVSVPWLAIKPTKALAIQILEEVEF